MVRNKWFKGALLGLALLLGAAPIVAQAAAATAVTIAPSAKQRFFDSNGVPLAGGLLFTYSAGTTTKLVTYTDSTGATPNTDPIVLDSQGYANVWMATTSAYKFTLSPSTDTDPPSNPIWTVDNLTSVTIPTLWATGGGTADAITATYSPANTTLTDGLLLGVRATAANATTTPTFSPDGLTAHTITKLGGAALQPGDIKGALTELLLRYNLANTRWELLNPVFGNIPWAVATGGADAITATYAPANLTLPDGILLSFRASAANATTTPTFAPDGLTAHTITKLGGTALTAGDIPAALAEMLVRYNLANTRWELLNPASSSLLPTQTNNNGKFLSTNGSSAAWSQMNPPVRQTVLTGAIDANGLPNFGGSTGSTTVTTATTLIITAANGADITGSVNRTCSITNASWTGLSTNGTMYLYVTVNADGTCTTASTTVQPVYQWGGSFSNVSGAFVYNIQTMTGNLGTGAANAQAYVTFVGEVAVAANVTTSITWYALMGRYVSPMTATLPATSAAVSFNHNIGTNVLIPPTAVFENTTNDNGFVVGERIYNVGTLNIVPREVPTTPTWTYKTAGFAASNGGGGTPWVTNPKGGGQDVALTLASWKYGVIVQRAF